MDWVRLQEDLLAEHVDRQQESASIVRAIRLAREALETLGRLGHPMHLAEGAEPPRSEWPRRLFHANGEIQGRIVRDAAEAALLGPGWETTVAAARAAAGRDRQFRGRGGEAPRAARLPAVIESIPAWARREAKWPTGLHRSIREEVLAERKKENPDA